jgi:hypothetical protein
VLTRAGLLLKHRRGHYAHRYWVSHNDQRYYLSVAIAYQSAHLDASGFYLQSIDDTKRQIMVVNFLRSLTKKCDIQ